MIGNDWFETATDKRSYWRIDPNNQHMRWHVSYQQAGVIGSKGEVVTADGWYWYTANWKSVRFSSMFGPFPSHVAAMADCETAHKPER